MKDKIYLSTYKSIPIKSDKRVHIELINYLKKYKDKIKDKKVECLDIASGKGAFTQQLLDITDNFIVDCNDLDKNNLANGYRSFFNIDLNTLFDFNKTYDFIFAIEIIEHLENPFQFIRQMKKHLKPGGIIFLSTPNVNSFFDRIHYFFTGYPYYFGSRGIINSEGHIMMCPTWLLEHIAENEKLKFRVISKNITTKGLNHLIGIKSNIILKILSPIKFLVKDYNNQSGIICTFEKNV